MLHKYITEIAQATQSSIPVVSKVINHRGGVNTDRRYQIYRYISDHSINIPTPANVEIYAILPDAPVFFWHEIYHLLKNYYLRPQDKLNIYSKVIPNQENEYIILKYLEHAIDCGAKCVLLSTPFSPSIIQAIRTVSCKVPVFLLSEDGDITDEQVYYIGSDAYRDGRMLAEYYESHHPSASSAENVLILFCNEIKNHVRRVEGFTDRLRQSGRYHFQLVHLPLLETKDYSSQLARVLYPISEQFPFDCIFSPDGYTPHVCGAIKKLGKERKVHCLGFENAHANKQYIASQLLSMIVKQNLSGQVNLAVEMARKYCKYGELPEKREYYVPSEIIQY